MSDSVFLKVSSAFLVGGLLAKRGEVVEVTNAEAKDLLARGKAVVATEKDAPVEKAPARVGLVEDEAPVVENEVVEDEAPVVKNEVVEDDQAVTEDKPKRGRGKK